MVCVCVCKLGFQMNKPAAFYDEVNPYIEIVNKSMMNSHTIHSLWDIGYLSCIDSIVRRRMLTCNDSCYSETQQNTIKCFYSIELMLTSQNISMIAHGLHSP